MHMPYRLLSAATAMLVAFACSAAPQEQCESYMKAQDYSRAIQAGRVAVKQNAQSGDAWFCLGRAYEHSGELDLAQKGLLQAERLFSRKGDLSAVYSFLGSIAKDKGDLQQALNYYSRSLALTREVGNKSAEASALNNIALIFASRGDLDKEEDYLRQSLAVEPDELKKATTYGNLGLSQSARGNYATALEQLEQAIAISRRKGDYRGAAITILNKGAVQIEQGALDAADATLRDGMQQIRKVGEKNWEATGLVYQGRLALARGAKDQAKSLYQQALQLARGIGATTTAESCARVLASLQRDASTQSFGVVEIGSKGVKAAVVSSFINDKGQPQYQAGFKKSINSDVIAGVVDTGEFTPEAIDSTAKATKDLVFEIRNQAKNVGDNIFIAGSSGLSAAMNRDELGRKVQELTGISPTFINSAQELYYAMIGSVPEALLYKTALLDIGSGNGRIGYLISPRGERKAGQAVIDLRAGSVALTELANKARAPGEAYLSALNRVVEKDIAPRFASDVKQYPVLSKHHYLMLVGGAAWSMTTLLHPENQSQYVQLSLQDLSDYYQRLASDPDKLLNPDLSSITDEKIRATAAKQVEAVKKTFTLENLQAGARILKLVADSAALGKAELYFNRDGNWAYGMAQSAMFGKRFGKN
jgi:tetratricopeptide (TPR) repeat protein